jgi:hypothetical protein
LPEIEDLKNKLEQHEQEQAAVKVETARKFDIKALAESTRRIHVIVDSQGREIRYGLLTRGEVKALQLDKIADQELFVDRLVFAMLKKADPELAQDDFDALPVDAKAMLLQTLSQVFTGFLPSPPSNGSKPTAKPS